MKRLYVIFGVVAMALSIGACKSNKEQSFRGVITEATMNTMAVATTAGDTLTVSTMDAERVVQDGILLGDTATVYYKEKPQNGMIMATKVVVVPGERECTGLLGSWVESIEGMPGQVQGLTMESGGVAKSVNMATLVYEQWKKEGEELLLSGKSIGNGLTINFEDTLHIEKLTADSLILSRGGYIIRYCRQD